MTANAWPICVVSMLLACVMACSGCEVGRPDAAYVIPGPTGPSAIPTNVPYVWDTREELEVWVHNTVSRGPLTINGDGRAAVVRIEIASISGNGSPIWVLRGPDFDPPVTGVRSVRIRYTWIPTLRGSTNIRIPGPTVNASFHVPGRQLSSDHFTVNADLEQTAPAEVVFGERYLQGFHPMDVGYVYLHSDGGNRGVVEIDSIALVQ